MIMTLSSTGSVHNECFILRPEYKEHATVLKFFETSNSGCIVREIKGCDYLEKEPDIKHYCLNLKIGDIIKEALNDSLRIGFYIACSNDISRLRCVMDKVKNDFKICYE